MRSKIRWLALVPVLLWGTAELMAQGPFGGGLPPGMAKGLLLSQDSVRKELKLSADQIQKLNALEEKRWKGLQEIFALEESQRAKKMQEWTKDGDKALAAILHAEQGKRLQQIVYQQQGTTSLTEAEVAQALGLSEAQSKQIRQVFELMNQRVRSLMQPGAPPSNETRTKIETLRKEGSEKALALLSDAQKAAWKGLQGEPFKGPIGFGGPRPADPAKFLDRITKALPDSAPAKPHQPRKLLLFSKTTGFRHSSIPVAVKALTMMGDKTGAYLAFHTEDESIFEPEKLKNFDAVFMVNTTGDCLRPSGGNKDEADRREAIYKESLVAFVAGGKGLAGLHSATDTYHGWKEYNQMMGGVFAGHPWTKKVPIKNLEPGHPLNAMFEGKDFEMNDEIYQFSLTTALPTERKFLLALDTSKMPDARIGIRKADGPYPISWVSTYGKGRTFYCSLGHREEIFCEPTIMKHYLAGIQYVLGDLEADATPTVRTTGDRK